MYKRVEIRGKIKKSLVNTQSNLSGDSTSNGSL